MTTTDVAKPNKRYRPPKKEPPADAADRIRALAADGWSLVGIASNMGVDVKTMRDRWFVEFPELKESVDQGREQERQTLHNRLYREAIEGTGRDSVIAAMFLLKARHGYREGEAPEDGARTHITFNLPSAIPLEQFMTIENGTRSTPQSVPGAAALPSRRG